MDSLELFGLANEEAKEKVCCGRYEKICPLGHDIESCQEKCSEYHRIAWDFLLNYKEKKEMTIEEAEKEVMDCGICRDCDGFAACHTDKRFCEEFNEAVKKMMEEK